MTDSPVVTVVYRVVGAKLAEIACKVGMGDCVNPSDSNYATPPTN